ncbi:hypothetical protein BGZ47_004113, partial [Haplosporangium gracile]
MKPLTRSIKETAVEKLRQEKETRTVACNLWVSVSSAIRIRNEDKQNIPKPHPGRSGKILTKTRTSLARHFIQGNLKSLKDGQRSVKSTEGEHVHLTTVEKNLRQEEIRAYSAPDKPKLTQEKTAKRLRFTKEHKNWAAEDWKN